MINVVVLSKTIKTVIATQVSLRVARVIKQTVLSNDVDNQVRVRYLHN